ncbi:hypothetical protein NUACC21_74870 [Scytonema sp. NUACC21]
MPSFITQANRRLLGYILVAIVSIILLGVAVWKIPQMQVASLKEQIDLLRSLSTQSIDFKDLATLEKLRVDTENAARTVIVQGVGGSFVFLTAFVAFLNYRETRRNVTVAEEKQVTERFAKAIEQLGNANIHVRLGAIYALERISKDSDKDYWQVMEILTAYVRETSPYPPRDKADNKPLWESVLSIHKKDNSPSTTDDLQDIPPIGTDIQAVLTVISRRAKSYGQGEENRLDLSKSDLSRANLSSANLSSADLSSANIGSADLNSAFLIDTNLRAANLEAANLKAANLEGANLIKADLLKANLEGANLIKADFLKANLEGADLEDANLIKANLSYVNLMGANLIKANLSSAYLGSADLSSAYLIGANLEGAYPMGANLYKANFYKANLSRANLSDANLSDALLISADLSDADLSDAKNLTPEQVKKAENWEKAKYSEEFRAKLGLPPESSENQGESQLA